MLRVKYNVKALEPLFHGSDQANIGNKRMFRRERHQIAPRSEASFFPDSATKRRACAVIFQSIYASIDAKLKSEYYGYYEPFVSNVIAATYSQTIPQFITKLCEMCGVRSINDQYIIGLDEAIGLFISDVEAIDTMRNEYQYLMLILRRAIKDKQILVCPSPSEVDFFTASSTYGRSFEEVPFISGNAIVGLMRRLAIRDFFKRIGYDRETMGVNKDIYHRLMTGGNISESTGKIDIGKKEQYARLCPPVALLGSALGDMTTTSLIKVGSLRPICLELGFENAPSFWQMLGSQFGTRHDSSKAEMDFDIINNGNDRNADQMIYQSEVLNAGSEMYAEMFLTSDDPLEVSCFWHILGLWQSFGYIAGRSARGMGRIDIDVNIPKGASDLYLAHLENVKDEALAFFTVNKQ